MRFRQRLNLVTALVGIVNGFIGSLFFVAYDLYIETLLNPSADWTSLARRDSWILLLVVLCSALLSLLVSRYFNASIAAPIVSLATASRVVTREHKFSVRLSHVGQDEVGELVAAFNEMMAMIERREADLSSANELFDRFMGHSPAVALIKDTALRYVFVNDAGILMLGRPREQIVGKTDQELWPEEVAERLQRLDQVALSEGTLGLHSLHQVEPIPTDEGTQYFSIVRFRLYDSLGNAYLGCSGLNETDRLQAEQALKASEERYALAVRGASDGMWDWDVEGETAYFSDRCSEILAPGARLGNTMPELLRCVHPDDFSMFERSLNALVDGSSDQLTVEFRLRSAPRLKGKPSPPEGPAQRWALTRATALRKEDGMAVRVAGFVTDISARKAEEAQLRKDAFHDSLTALPNRALFLERLGRAVDRLRRHPEDLFGVLFLDLDGFKAVNDSLGHHAGDLLLVATAQRLKQQVRGEDTVARLGGDEFAILLSELRGPADVVLVCERLLTALREPVDVEQQSVRIGTSIGVALSTTRYERSEQMLADADSAMYLAKRSGKSTFRIFDVEMHRQAEARMDLEARLRTGLEAGQMELYFQPMVRLEDQRVVAVEALLRWLEPDRGCLEPAEFLEAAEDTGLLGPIGQATIPAALGHWKRWRERHPDLGLCINLSVRQFQHPAVVYRWQEWCAEAGVGPAGITLEVTEKALARDAAGGRATLQSLRDAGFLLALDDFGTGSSSLELVRSCPFTAVKIDHRLLEGGDSGRLVSGLVQLAVGLDRMCVAEGVENSSQLEPLRQAGCQLAQGYLWSKAVPAAEVDVLLTASPV